MSKMKDHLILHQELQLEWLLKSNGYESWLDNVKANNEASGADIDKMERDLDKSPTAIGQIISVASFNNANYVLPRGEVS